MLYHGDDGSGTEITPYDNTAAESSSILLKVAPVSHPELRGRGAKRESGGWYLLAKRAKPRAGDLPAIALQMRRQPALAGLCLILLLFAAGAATAQNAPQIARSVSAALGAQGRLMWVDGTANVARTITQDGRSVTVDYTTTREGVIDVVHKCKAAHINTLVIDVKPLSGQTLYASKIAPRMREWKGHKLPDFDVLAAFVEEGHKAGLQVDACVNILSEGHKYFSVGLAYEHPEWQSIVYTVDRGLTVPLTGGRLSVRVPGEPSDPAAPTVLADENAILGSEPTSGLVGLESVDSKGGEVNSSAVPGKQLNIVMDGDNKCVGIVDSALLGDDPLIAPEGGHLIPATRDADRAWCAANVKPGTLLVFDIQTSRVPIAQAPSEKIACFVNPLHPEARKHELDIVRELVTNYDIDGLVLDRCRFSNLYNEFSDRTREAFTQWLRSRRSPRSIAQWPQDIFTFSKEPNGKMKEGPLYKPWLEFRAQVIRDFVADVAKIVRTTKPSMALGTYVGSWYPAYYEVGVNWGSPKTKLRYPWFTPDYPMTGYAEFFDWVSTGCYYPTATREDARANGLSEKGTVEYAAQLSDLAVADGAFVYAGVYVVDYMKHPEIFAKALDAAGRQTQGWMIFDLSYINDYNWWPYLESAYRTDAIAPERLSGVLSEIRSARDEAARTK